MKITRTLIAALSASALAAPAFAGSAAPAAMEPMIEAPAPAPMAMGRDWTGGYAGVQLGYADVSTNIDGVEGDDMIGGLTAGYDWDLGNYVLGVGLDADIADLAVSDALTLERVYRLKVRGGYDLGNGLIYATAGGVGADVDGLGYDTGYFIGAGYEHMLTDSISLGGEVLYHEFDNFQDTADVEATTFQVRANYRF